MQGQLQNVIAAEPMDLVAIDILSELSKANDGSKDLLVAVDYFMKWVETYSLQDEEASTRMKVLYNNFFSPTQLHSDQGRNFESNLVAELAKITGIRKTRTTPFHPRSDVQTERMIGYSTGKRHNPPLTGCDPITCQGHQPP